MAKIAVLAATKLALYAMVRLQRHVGIALASTMMSLDYPKTGFVYWLHSSLKVFAWNLTLGALVSKNAFKQPE